MSGWTFLILVMWIDTTIGTAQPTTAFETQQECQAERERVISSYRFFSLHGLTVHLSSCYFARERAN